MEKVQLRTYVFIDSMQPQFASYSATTAQGYLPVSGQTALYVEIAPGMEINRVMDIALKAEFTEASIKEISIQFLNTSYLWGGRSVFGIDCSGFVQQVFRFFNKPLQRDAYQQATDGEVVGFLQEAKCGDLAFFDNEEGKITHVGILYNADTIIHASGKVRIDKIDNMGIVNSDTGERTHNLRIIKRY